MIKIPPNKWEVTEKLAVLNRHHESDGDFTFCIY